jgi:hypothetical protein
VKKTKRPASQFKDLSVTNRRTRSGHVTVGAWTIFAAGGGSKEQLAEITESHLESGLRELRRGFFILAPSRQRAALRHAWDLLSAHRPDQASWPDWVRDGIGPELSRDDTPSTGRRGRHAKEATLRRQRYIDMVRTMYVCRLLNEGLELPAACARASRELRIRVDGQEIASSAKVFRQAYDRS